MNKIDQIRNKMTDICAQITNLEKQFACLIIQEQNAYLELKGIEKGKTVIIGKDGSEYIVEGVYSGSNGVIFKGDWLTGFKIKKDGTPGTQLKTIYSPWVIKQ